MLRLWASDQADALAQRLSDQLRLNPLADPLSSEFIAVPSRGIERWISQQLANRSMSSTDGVANRGDGGPPTGSGGMGFEGISANTTYVLLHDYLTELSGVSARGTDSPWHPRRLRWTVAKLVDQDLRDANLGVLTDYLRSQANHPGNRIDATRYVAELFDRYHWQRPEMIGLWATGIDEIEVGKALPPQHLWQPTLWRAARHAINAPSPAESMNRRELGADPRSLPPRLSVFGLTRLTLGQARVLRQLSEHIDVDLYLLFPSRAVWEEIARTSLNNATSNNATSVGSRDAVDDAEVRHPILRSWASDATELERVLANVAPASVQAATWVLGGQRANSTLGDVQRQILDDKPPGTADASAAKSDDQSISIHACHGAKRQVEVLRDAIKHALADDPSLEPRDVLVMCPDIEQFAPHIRSVFEAEPELRVRLADRAPIFTNPLVAVVVNLLKLASTRCAAPDVVSFLSQPLVRRKFGIEEEDLPRISDWILDADVRWGLSVQHRRVWGVDIANTNTWDSGLDQLALGVAMADDKIHLVGQTRPLDDVPSSDIPLAAAFIDFLAVLEDVVMGFLRDMTLREGLDGLGDAMDGLVDAAGPDEWMRRSFRADLDELKANVTGAGAGELATSLEYLTMLLSDYQRGRSSRENFRSGDITFCTLTPMRSVPHRVVALLGMDDGTFPRADRATGDDVTVTNPQIGDWDPRKEDRQLLLDALMAAQEKLIITYTGHDERTNEPRNPCVPIAELMDVLTQMRDPDGQAGDGGSVVASHPLHPFDARNFQPGALGGETVWSFSRDDWLACQAAAGPRSPTPSFMNGELPQVAPKFVDVSDLIGFVKHPTKHLFHRRLNLAFQKTERSLQGNLPVEVDGLSRWKQGNELLSLLSDASDDSADALIAQWLHARQTSASLGPTQEQRQGLARIAESAKAIDVQKRRRVSGSLRSEFFAVGLASGVEVAGAIRVASNGRVVRATPSNVLLYSTEVPTPSAALELWVEVLVRAAATGDRTLGYLVGRGAAKSAVTTVTFQSPTDSRGVLTDLVELYLAGINRPLKLFPRTSARAAASSPNSARAAIAHAWENDRYDPECSDEYHQRAFPGLTAAELMNSEEFWSLARTLWAPVLDNMHIGRDG